MDDIILRVSRHYITGIIGILGLGAATYAIRRYLSNNEKTTSTYYTRTDELNTIHNLTSLANPSARKIYIFWNGSFNSTYLLLDYLQQDYILQPIYIERYTIRKTLEHDQLLKYTAEYKQSKQQSKQQSNLQTNTQCAPIILEYLANVAKMKRQQSQEISQLTTLRRVIANQYPEFRANLLPTRYITIIEKDLAHSQRCYDALRVLKLQPLDYAGIELYEQASRYVAHMPSNIEQIDALSGGQSSNQKIVMGYSQDSHLTSIIKKIEKDLTTNSTRYKIDLPLADISNSTLKYLASQKINKEVMRFIN
jgi:hypothetical protein